MHAGFADNDGASINEALDAPGGGTGVGGGSTAAGGFGEGQTEGFGRAGNGKLVFDEDGNAGEGGAGREGDMRGGGGGSDGKDGAECVDGWWGQEGRELACYCGGGCGLRGVGGGVVLAREEDGFLPDTV